MEGSVKDCVLTVEKRVEKKEKLGISRVEPKKQERKKVEPPHIGIDRPHLNVSGGESQRLEKEKKLGDAEFLFIFQ